MKETLRRDLELVLACFINSECWGFPESDLGVPLDYYGSLFEG